LLGIVFPARIHLQIALRSPRRGRSDPPSEALGRTLSTFARNLHILDKMRPLASLEFPGVAESAAQ
jgi:hypothetical protein